MRYYGFEELTNRLKEAGEAAKRAGEAAKRAGEAFKSLIELYDDECPNKRIIYLAKYHKNPRVRKKNRKRILRGKW